MRLDGRKDIQSVKSNWSVLHSDLKAHVVPPLGKTHKECKTNTHIHTSTRKILYTFIHMRYLFVQAQQ